MFVIIILFCLLLVDWWALKKIIYADLLSLHHLRLQIKKEVGEFPSPALPWGLPSLLTFLLVCWFCGLSSSFLNTALSSISLPCCSRKDIFHCLQKVSCIGWNLGSSKHVNRANPSAGEGTPWQVLGVEATGVSTTKETENWPSWGTLLLSHMHASHDPVWLWMMAG